MIKLLAKLAIIFPKFRPKFEVIQYRHELRKDVRQSKKDIINHISVAMKDGEDHVLLHKVYFYQGIKEWLIKKKFTIEPGPGNYFIIRWKK